MNNRTTIALSLLLVICLFFDLVRGRAQEATGLPRGPSDLQQGIELFQNGKYPEARQALQAAAQRTPASSKSFFYLALTEDRLNERALAEQHLRRALELDPHSGSVLYDLGVLLLEEKKSREAIPYLEKAGKTGAQTPELSINLVRAYLDEGRKAQALALAGSARRRYTSAAFNLTLGEVLLSYGLSAEARDLLQDANRADPGRLEIVLPLSRACLQEKDFRAAQAALSSVERAGQNDPEFHALLAQSYVLSNDKDQALAEMGRAVALSSDNPLYLLREARYYQKYGNQTRALEILAKAARLAPNLPDIPYSIAISHFIADEYVEAARYAAEAVHLAPADDRAIFLQGISLFAMLDKRAEALLLQAIHLKPRNPFYQCFEGMLLATEDRISEAEQRLRIALDLYPSYALAHYQLGRLLERERKYPEARVHLEKAVALGPELTEAYFVLAHVYMRVGEKDKAQQAMATFKSHRAEEFSERQEILRRAAGAFESTP